MRLAEGLSPHGDCSVVRLAEGLSPHGDCPTVRAALRAYAATCYATAAISAGSMTGARQAKRSQT